MFRIFMHLSVVFFLVVAAIQVIFIDDGDGSTRSVLYAILMQLFAMEK